MWIVKRIHHRFKEMLGHTKYIRTDSKFLLITFLICLIPIGISAFVTEMSMEENMANLRTMFLSIFGYIIENASRTDASKQIDKGKKKDCEEASAYRQIESTQVETAHMNIKEDSDESTKEGEWIQKDLRILIAGHLLIAITIILVIGVFIHGQEDNQSLVVLRHSSYACIGFLVSASKSGKEKI